MAGYIINGYQVISKKAKLLRPLVCYLSASTGKFTPRPVLREICYSCENKVKTLNVQRAYQLNLQEQQLICQLDFRV